MYYNLYIFILILFKQFKSNKFTDFIQNNIQQKNEQIKGPEKNLKDEIQDNKDSQKDELEEYKEKYYKCKEENESLKNNYNIVNNEVTKLKEEIALLKNQLNTKDNEINNLKNKIQKEEPKFNLADIIIVYFRPNDASFYEGIKCLSTDTFADVEEKLYKKRNELRDTNNTFIFNAKPVLRFKTLEENHIKDGDIINLFKLE